MTYFEDYHFTIICGDESEENDDSHEI